MYWQVTNSEICLSGTSITLDPLTVAWASSALWQSQRGELSARLLLISNHLGWLSFSVCVFSAFSFGAIPNDHCRNLSSFFAILERKDQCVNDSAWSQNYYCTQLRFKEIKLLAGGHEYQGGIRSVQLSGDNPCHQAWRPGVQSLEPMW